MFKVTNTITSAPAGAQHTDRDEFFATAQSVGLTLPQANSAWTNLTSGTTRFLVLSGKMGSGKDTLAPLVMRAMGTWDAEHLYYASALKDEANAMFATIRQFPTPESAASAMAEKFALPEREAQMLTNMVFDQVHQDRALHSRCRTNEVRAFLQVLGTDVRRQQDENYWVRIGMRDALEKISEGKSVYLTDARFPNEVSFARSLGATAIRLSITDNTQTFRLLERDGVLPEASAFTHPSETALDGYSDYSAVIENDGSIATAVHAIVSFMVDGYVR